MNKRDLLIQNSYEHLIIPVQNWQNWRLKSLNSGLLQQHSLPLMSKQQMQIMRQKPGDKGEQQVQKQTPKITKINENVFCILMNNTLSIFSYIDETQREKRKTGNKFVKTIANNIVMPNQTEWVYGDGTSTFYIASQHEIVAIKIQQISVGKQQQITQVWRKKISNIKSISVMASNLQKKLIVIAQQIVYFFDVNKNFELMKEMPINFTTQSSGWSNISNINGICTIIQSLNVFYFIGTSIQLKADVRMKLGRGAQTKNQLVQKKCQALYLTKFQIKKNQVQARVFIIDHIFQVGIFKKSRAYQVGSETFLLSLHQQIIVIRRNFSKFMVWDNVSIMSSKSNEKKGQLVLGDKRIMVYTQSGQISAHQLFFNFEKASIETPKIDSFRGNNSQQQILYEGIILQYKKQTYMKVLFYFKQNQVYVPNKPSLLAAQTQIGGSKGQISFQIMCIEQTEPTQKLKQLLSKANKGQQIQSFLKRFNINDLRYKKSEWQVSAKGQKQIQQLLLNIKDNEYIQSQLTKILKSKPHDLQFLITIEKRQIERYKFMLAAKLLKYEEHNERQTQSIKVQPNIVFQTISQFFILRQLDEIKLIIQWFLESKMFQQKLNYSLNFMTFQQYSFIEIGKLRAISLREEIKLLGVKGYEKRLKYFVNSFKYLVLDDFRTILRFVICDLNQDQLRIFFTKNFPFILPSYVQPEGQDRCKLWDDTFKQDENKIQTIEHFYRQSQKQINKLSATIPQLFKKISAQKALQVFCQIFQQFMKQPWFVTNSYKQHSILHHNLQQLKQTFCQLKEVEVYNIILELLYEKIEQKVFKQNKVKIFIQNLQAQKYISLQYKKNIEARLQVYSFVADLVSRHKKQFLDTKLPARSKFIILKQSQYFCFVFEHFSKYLIGPIKDIYESKQEGLFLQKLTKYLYSPLAKLEKLIQFIDIFKQVEEIKYDNVRSEVFQCICKMMKITDYQNSSNLLNKIKQMPIIMKSKRDRQKFSVDKLTDQAKFALSIDLTPLFQDFQIDYNFSQLIAETNYESIQDTKIIKQLICNYTQFFKIGSTPTSISFPQHQLINDPICPVQLSSPVDFVSLLLFLHDSLGYRFQNKQILQLIIVRLCQMAKFQQTRLLIQDLIQFGTVHEHRLKIQQFAHYSLLNRFKHDISIKPLIEDIIIQWVSQKYEYLANKLNKKQQHTEQQKMKAQISQIFFGISSILKILNSFTLNQRIQLQISKISLFSNIKQLSQSLLISFLPGLINEAGKYAKINSFIFMINLLNNIKESKEVFGVHERQKILEILLIMNKIHKQYVSVYHEKNTKSEELLLGELCRFNAEFVVALTKWKYPRFAGFVLLDLINSSYYYRDVLFYFISRIIQKSKVELKAVQKIVYEFMNIENIHDLKKILSNFIVKYQLGEVTAQKQIAQNAKTIFSQILKNNQLDEAFYFAIRNVQVSPNQFQQIALSMNKFRDDHITTQTLLISFIRVTKQRVEGQNSPTFMVFKRKLNCLMRPLQRIEVIKDIVIVMDRLQVDSLKNKITLLKQKPKISVSKKSIADEKQLINKSIKQIENQELEQQNSFTMLKFYYQKFMKMQNLNPWLTINAQQAQPSAIRIEKYPQYTVDERQSKQQYYKILPLIRQQQTQEVKQLRKKLFDNQQRLKQIQQGNRQLMEQQIAPAITQAKINAQKQYNLSLLEKKRKKKQEEQLQQKQKKKQEQQEEYIDPNDKMAQIKNQQKQKIAGIKNNYSSKIVQQTQDLIAELRQRRRKLKQQTAATSASDFDRKKEQQKAAKQLKDAKTSRLKSQKSGKPGQYYIDTINEDVRNSVVFGAKGFQQPDIKSSVRIAPSKDRLKTEEDILGKRSAIMSQRDQFRQRLDLLKESHLRGTTINRLMAERNGQFYVPRWEQKTPMRLQFQDMLTQKSKKSSAYLQKAKKQLQQQKKKQKQKAAVKLQQSHPNLQALVDKFKLLNEQYISEIIEKIPLLLNNPTACAQIVHDMYQQCKQLKNFIQICKDLLIFNPIINEVIEHKSIKILQDSMRIKIQINMRQIFPPQFFTSVHSVAIRDYYHIAYGIIQPSIVKLMNQHNYNVNSLAMVIRFGFGSNSQFTYKVYEDYVRSLLENYQSKSQFVFVQKDIMQLSQKLRTIYNNLNPSNRRIKLQQLVQQIKSLDKRKALIKSMSNNLQNKSSLINKQQYEDFRFVLTKLETNVSNSE